MQLRKFLLPVQKQHHPFDEKIARVNQLLAYCGILSILFWLAEFFIVFQHSQPGCDVILATTINRYTIWRSVYPPTTTPLQAIYTALTAAMLVMLCVLYGFLFISQRTLKQKKQTLGFFRSKYVFMLLVELFICVLQPIPFKNLNQAPIDNKDMLATPTIAVPDPVDPNVLFDESMVGYGILMLGRIYLVVRYIRDHTDIYKKRKEAQGLKLRRFAEVNFDWQLSLKVMYARRPAVFAAAFVGTILLCGALGFFVTEWNAAFHIDSTGCIGGSYDTFNVQTSFYIAIITLATVGYGDYFPVTPLGRLTAALVAIGGMFSSAIIVSTFFRWLDLTPMEMCVKVWCDAQKFSQLERNGAAIIIQKFWRSLGISRRGKASRSLQAGRSSRRRRPIHTPPSEEVLAEIHAIYVEMKKNRLQKVLSINEHQRLVEEVDQDGVEIENDNGTPSETIIHDLPPPPPPLKQLQNGDIILHNNVDAATQLQRMQERFGEFEKETLSRQTTIEGLLDKLAVAGQPSGKGAPAPVSQEQMNVIAQQVGRNIDRLLQHRSRTQSIDIPKSMPLPKLQSSAEEEPKLQDWV